RASVSGHERSGRSARLRAVSPDAAAGEGADGHGAEPHRRGHGARGPTNAPSRCLRARATPATRRQALRPRARDPGVRLGSRRAWLMTSEPLRALVPVIEVLRALDVAYAIGGSMASSVFGEPRSTADI